MGRLEDGKLCDWESEKIEVGRLRRCEKMEGVKDGSWEDVKF